MCYLCCLSLLVFDVTRCSVYCLVDWWSLCLAAGDTVAAPCLWQCHGEPSLHPRAQGSHWHGGWWEGKPCCVEARTFTEHLLLSLWFILKVVLVDPTMPTHLPSQMSPPHPHPCKNGVKQFQTRKIWLMSLNTANKTSFFLVCLTPIQQKSSLTRWPKAVAKFKVLLNDVADETGRSYSRIP